MTDLQKIAADLELCDFGQAFARGRAKTKFTDHRKACYAAIKEMNERDGLANMSDDELLAELGL
jgi:hypothetical protein